MEETDVVRWETDEVMEVAVLEKSLILLEGNEVATMNQMLVLVLKKLVYWECETTVKGGEAVRWEADQVNGMDVAVQEMLPDPIEENKFVTLTMNAILVVIPEKQLVL